MGFRLVPAGQPQMTDGDEPEDDCCLETEPEQLACHPERDTPRELLPKTSTETRGNMRAAALMPLMHM